MEHETVLPLRRKVWPSTTATPGCQPLKSPSLTTRWRAAGHGHLLRSQIGLPTNGKATHRIGEVGLIRALIGTPGFHIKVAPGTPGNLRKAAGHRISQRRRRKTMMMIGTLKQAQRRRSSRKRKAGKSQATEQRGATIFTQLWLVIFVHLPTLVNS